MGPAHSIAINALLTKYKYKLYSTAYIGTATIVISDMPLNLISWRWSHYDVCRLWRLSYYDVRTAYDVCRQLWRLSLIGFVAVSLHLILNRGCQSSIFVILRVAKRKRDIAKPYKILSTNYQTLIGISTIKYHTHLLEFSITIFNLKWSTIALRISAQTLSFCSFYK